MTITPIFNAPQVSNAIHLFILRIIHTQRVSSSPNHALTLGPPPVAIVVSHARALTLDHP